MRARERQGAIGRSGIGHEPRPRRLFERLGHHRAHGRVRPNLHVSTDLPRFRPKLSHLDRNHGVVSAKAGGCSTNFGADSSEVGARSTEVEAALTKVQACREKLGRRGVFDQIWAALANVSAFDQNRPVLDEIGAGRAKFGPLSMREAIQLRGDAHETHGRRLKCTHPGTITKFGPGLNALVGQISMRPCVVRPNLRRCLPELGWVRPS